jgi:hypothetical protein
LPSLKANGKRLNGKGGGWVAPPRVGSSKCLWRIYEDGSGYSQTSGATINKGKAIRDVDFKIMNFLSKEAAAEYAQQLTREVREIRARAAARKEAKANGN